MGREVRRVPEGWVHPVDGVYTMGRSAGEPRHIALYDGCTLEGSLARWDEENAKWQRGELPEYATKEDLATPFDEWDGPRPDPVDYMPCWTEEEATHWQMYETCSEGTPISPVMADPESLGRWLVDNGANTFADYTADLESWMKIILGDADAFFMWSSERGPGVSIC